MNFREQQKLNFKLKLLDHEYIRIRGKLREEIMATKALQQKFTKSTGWLDYGVQSRKIFNLKSIEA